MTSIGICTVRDCPEDLNYEKHRLYEEALLVYDKVYLIDPRYVTYKFIRDTLRPIITLDGQRLENLDTLIARGTKGREASTALLVRTLKACGCDILDPVERYSVGKASKLLSTITRYQKRVGTTSFVAFSCDSAELLLRDLAQEREFPLITKPLSGRQGNGITMLHNLENALNYVRDFYLDASEEKPFYMQKFMQFKKEYRILVFDGKVLGSVQKIPAPGHIAANAAQGATFVSINIPNIATFVVEHVSDEGLIGVDVALDDREQIHIIETNRAPLWETFEKTAGVDVAKIIIEDTKKRVKRGLKQA